MVIYGGRKKGMVRYLVIGVFLAIAGTTNAFAQTQGDRNTGGIVLDGNPGLVITPTRLVMEGRSRTARVTISNNGTKAGSYRISLVHKRMLEDGSIITIEEGQEEANDQFADDLVRMAPRQATLNPGQSQTIRLLVRKPKDLAEGEYRSHLQVMAVPVDMPGLDETDSEGVNVKVQANFAISIPLIIRHGTLEAEAHITDATFIPAAGETKAKASFVVHRDGKKSIFGDVKILYIDVDGKERLVKDVKGLAIYTSITRRAMEFVLEGDSAFQSGHLKVEYIDASEDTETPNVLASAEIPL